MISSKLTSISGSSDFFEGSIISYSNYLKNRILNVPKEVINKHGAVSHQTALSMVKGLEKISKSEILVSVTGVAGPKGGSIKTPVGRVYFGIGIKIKHNNNFCPLRAQKCLPPVPLEQILFWGHRSPRPSDKQKRLETRLSWGRGRE